MGAGVMNYITEEEVDRLRLIAFETNAERDKWNYYRAAAQWFNERDYRLLSDPLRQNSLAMLAFIQSLVSAMDAPLKLRKSLLDARLPIARALIAKATGATP